MSFKSLKIIYRLPKICYGINKIKTAILDQKQNIAIWTKKNCNVNISNGSMSQKKKSYNDFLKKIHITIFFNKPK